MSVGSPTCFLGLVDLVLIVFLLIRAAVVLGIVLVEPLLQLLLLPDLPLLLLYLLIPARISS